jgi:hypothetical protein
VAKLSRQKREEIAEKRLFSILGSHGIATARTLEQKISDAGPYNQRIDPHILTEVRNRMVEENKLVRTTHANVPSFSIVGADGIQIAARLALQLPVYRSINGGNIATRVGQALEIATYRCLVAADAEFYGRFRDLDEHDDSTLYSKEEPPQHIGKRALEGKQNLDFLLRDNSAGWMGLECKNVREWLYPDREELLDTLKKCLALHAVPVIIARRIPYVSFRLLGRCGVIFHENYNQRIPASEKDLADKAKRKDLLGYHDIRTGNEPDDRMVAFFQDTLPNIAEEMRKRYEEYYDLLAAWAHNAMTYEEFAAQVRRREQGINEDFEG